MERKVRFRRYTLPDDDGERGEFIESFSEKIEGETLVEIGEKANTRAEQLSKEWKEDVHVFEILV